MLEHLEEVKVLMQMLTFLGFPCFSRNLKILKSLSKPNKTHQDSSAPWQLIVGTLEIDFKICQRNSKKSENAKSRTWLSSNKSKTKAMRHLWCVTVSESLTWMTQSPRPHGATLGIPIPYPARKERLPHAQLPPIFWNSACGLSIYSWMV